MSSILLIAAAVITAMKMGKKQKQHAKVSPKAMVDGAGKAVHKAQGWVSGRMRKAHSPA